MTTQPAHPEPWQTFQQQLNRVMCLLPVGKPHDFGQVLKDIQEADDQEWRETQHKHEVALAEARYEERNDAVWEARAELRGVE